MDKEIIIIGEIHEAWIEISNKAEELEKEYGIDKKEFVRALANDLQQMARFGW